MSCSTGAYHTHGTLFCTKSCAYHVNDRSMRLHNKITMDHYWHTGYPNAYGRSPHVEQTCTVSHPPLLILSLFSSSISPSGSLCGTKKRITLSKNKQAHFSHPSHKCVYISHEWELWIPGDSNQLKRTLDPPEAGALQYLKFYKHSESWNLASNTTASTLAVQRMLFQKWCYIVHSTDHNVLLCDTLFHKDSCTMVTSFPQRNGLHK